MPTTDYPWCSVHDSPVINPDLGLFMCVEADRQIDNDPDGLRDVEGCVAVDAVVTWQEDGE